MALNVDVTTRVFTVVKKMRPRETAIREMWTDLDEGLVGKLLRAYLPCLGHFLLGKFLRRLATLGDQKGLSEKRLHAMIDAAKKYRQLTRTMLHKEGIMCTATLP